MGSSLSAQGLRGCLRQLLFFWFILEHFSLLPMGCAQSTVLETSEIVMDKADEPVGSPRNVSSDMGKEKAAKPAPLIASAGMWQEGFALHAEASRVFDLAHKGPTGRLEMQEFAYIRQSNAMADALSAGCLSPRNHKAKAAKKDIALGLK